MNEWPAPMIAPESRQHHGRQSDGALTLAPRPHDKRSWRVAWDSVGAGTPKEPEAPAAHRLLKFWIFVSALLAIYFLAPLVIAQPSGRPRLTLPFSPYFLDEVQSGNVKSISSHGDTIQGEFVRKVVYRPNRATSTVTTSFSTEVPSFWNNDALTSLLQRHNVEINARAPDSATPAREEILLGLSLMLLFVLLLVALTGAGDRRGLAGRART
jgi:cell division protease FtsH